MSDAVATLAQRIEENKQELCRLQRLTFAMEGTPDGTERLAAETDALRTFLHGLQHPETLPTKGALEALLLKHVVHYVRATEQGLRRPGWLGLLAVGLVEGLPLAMQAMLDAYHETKALLQEVKA